MSALIRWSRSPKQKRAQSKVGDRREVRKFLLIPRRIGDEVRWLGVETIQQEAYQGWCQPPEMKGWACIKWRDVSWGDV